MKNEHYRRWVSSLPCCVTGSIGNNAPHHVIGNNWLTGKSGSMKGSDLTCIPLCDDMHKHLHHIGHASFEFEQNMSQIEVMVKTILLAENLGVIKIDNKIAKAIYL